MHALRLPPCVMPRDAAHAMQPSTLQPSMLQPSMLHPMQCSRARCGPRGRRALRHKIYLDLAMHAAPRTPTPTLTLTLEPGARAGWRVLCLARAERRSDGRRGLVRRARAGGAGGAGAREHRRGA